MNKQPTRMLNDQSETAFVRGLLQAGAEDRVADIDYKRGLAKHLTIIAAGTLLPAWAKGLASSASTSSAVTGLSAKVIAFVVGLPIVTAGAVASFVLSNQELETRPAETTESTLAQNSQNSSLTGSQQIAPLDGTATIDREASNKQNRRQPTATARRRHQPLYPKRTTNRIAPTVPARDREAITKFPSRELSSSHPADPRLRRDQELTIQPATEPAEKEQIEKKQVVSIPVIERRAISEIRQEHREQAKKSRVDENPFERETRMLAAANRLLESNPEQSLKLAKRGEREFPGSMFTEERRHVLILALIRLSRVEEARQLAGPYLRDYPKSPFAQRIRHALAKVQQEQ